MAELKSTEINGNLILNGELQPKDNKLQLPKDTKIFVGDTEFQGSGSASIDIGGENLGLVKNGGNVIINEEGEMNAELEWKTESITNKPQIYAGNAVGSVVEGLFTKATYPYQHVQGKYNDEGDYAIIVGNGEENNPRNIYTLDWDGNGYFEGGLDVVDSIRVPTLIVDEIYIGNFKICIENDELTFKYIY